MNLVIMNFRSKKKSLGIDDDCFISKKGKDKRKVHGIQISKAESSKKLPFNLSRKFG